jgi:hypothetical protein
MRDIGVVLHRDTKGRDDRPRFAWQLHRMGNSGLSIEHWNDFLIPLGLGRDYLFEIVDARYSRFRQSPTIAVRTSIMGWWQCSHSKARSTLMGALACDLIRGWVEKQTHPKVLPFFHV